MCGIAGKIYLNKQSIVKANLKKMSTSIAHRGPDDEGFYISPNKKIGLVNRRLAVIDLSSRGHQPMTYKNNIITFNGEIYNFQIERKKLEKAGYRFKSKTDTEVILALYDRYGFSCLKYLRGMYALAIYDKRRQLIFFARDRIGKKPLKYYFDKNCFIFASELKAILTQKEVKKEPDYLAVDYYLTYGYTPSPLTGFVGIKKLPPGHYMVLDLKNKKLSIKNYWKPTFAKKLNLSEGEWIERILKEIEEATRLRMISDVPIGAFLSGGVDSSGIVANMAMLSDKPIETFTIGFKDKKYNELEHAKRIARLYKTNHTELTVEPKSIEMLPELAFQYEEPYADASAVITSIVSKLASKHVTVILNGDGGDENFAGYDRHLKINRDVFFDRFSILKPGFLSIFSTIGKFTSHRFVKKGTKFVNKSLTSLSERYVSYNQYLSQSDKKRVYRNTLKRLLIENNPHDFAEEIFKKSDAKDFRDRGLVFDLISYLPQDLLAKVDIASMANSLEARSPLLDHKVIELAAQIPYGLKVRRGETKYILKKAFEKLVPKENLYREKKGFSVPLDKWFTGKLNKYASSKLLKKTSMTKDIFDQSAIKKMLESHTIDNDLGPKLWSILTLELWFENFFK